MARRLLGSFGASIMGPAVTALVQMINVPVMLRTWGPELYGEWLLLSAAPAYLLLSDFGFGNVAGTDMTLRVSAGDRDGALETYQSTQMLVLLTSALIALVVLTALWLLPLGKLLHFAALTTGEARRTLLLLSLNCLVVLQWSVLMAGYRCSGHYAQGMFAVNCLRVVEGASVFVVLFTRARPVQLAALMLLVSVVGTAWLALRLRRWSPWLGFGVRHARWARVRELASPAFAFMAFPAGNALSTQGMTILVGVGLGPLAVALFNSMRTLSRFVLQLSNAVLNAFWPELSGAFGRNDFSLARRLHQSAFQSAIVLSIGGATLLACIGPRLFTAWTRGKMAMDAPTFRILLVSAVVYAAWIASSSVPLALNAHRQIALFFLLCTTASLGAAAILIRPWGLRGVAVAGLAAEIAMSVHVVRVSTRLLDERWKDFWPGLFDRSHAASLWTKMQRRFPARSAETDL